MKFDQAFEACWLAKDLMPLVHCTMPLPRKNLANYPFDEKDGKQYLEDLCSMKGWSDRKLFWTFFLGMI